MDNSTEAGAGKGSGLGNVLGMYKIRMRGIIRVGVGGGLCWKSMETCENGHYRTSGDIPLGGDLVPGSGWDEIVSPLQISL